MMFAKLYETEEYGQVLVMLDTNDDHEPAIKFFTMPPELGICSASMSFKDTEEGWDKAEAGFEEVDEETAISVAKQLWDAVDD